MNLIFFLSPSPRFLNKLFVFILFDSVLYASNVECSNVQVHPWISFRFIFIRIVKYLLSTWNSFLYDVRCEKIGKNIFISCTSFDAFYFAFELRQTHTISLKLKQQKRIDNEVEWKYFVKQLLKQCGFFPFFSLFFYFEEFLF